MRWLGLATIAVGLVGVAAAAADTYNGDALQGQMQLTAPSSGSRAELGVGTLRGSLRTVSFRARSGLKIVVPRGRPGERIGLLTLSTRGGRREYVLRLPGAYEQATTLISKGGLTVRLRAASSDSRRPKPFLTVSGIPAEVRDLLVVLRRAVTRSSGRCGPRLLVETYVVRRGARDGKVTSGQRC